MKFPSIRIEGAILSPDILGQIEELPGQGPLDFGFSAGAKVKDEIARAWADAQDYWRIFRHKLENVRQDDNATSETRNLWMIPLLGLLRYDIEYQPRGTKLNGRIYTISHRVTNRADTAVHIIGARDPAGLDRKPSNANRRMSAHALVQEFLNLHDQLYGLVTDGHALRLLRDSSRLVKQSYLEFDLDRIFTDGLFADFAILYRLLHSTRLPLTDETAAESLIEQYHQNSLDSGARIREGLSEAVEKAVLHFGNGFLSHPDNETLRAVVARGDLSADGYYQQLLRLIYRLLFLMVIEERNLVFPIDAPRSQRDIYYGFYSVSRLRRLSEKRYLADPRRHDLWLALQACFHLFEANGPGIKLGVAPLAGDLFSAQAMHLLADCTLSNDVLLKCLRFLSLYRHPDSNQFIRVNYAALNVEEFGSIYEGLLEYEPKFTGERDDLRFELVRGGQRASTGSHYTPDDLVQPLIRHSLDHLIAKSLKAADPEVALLDLRVADIACGSGHILLAAARRIATQLAAVCTGEEQPSPLAYRAALRDTIRNCIYGVDLNPLAVELCKVALWLEAHIPGQPLNFLDHHVKCGNAIVGFARREELGQGVPTEAFKALPGDNKEIAASYRIKNKEDLQHRKQIPLDFTTELRGHLESVLGEWELLSALPETTSEEIEVKKGYFDAFVQSPHADFLRTIADIPVAQFYIAKKPGNELKIVTDGEFRSYWHGQRMPQGQGAETAGAIGREKRFFHWFLEFPEIMERGGFDCILGNPPYLGGRALGRTYGQAFCECMKWLYTPTGLSDLVVYFLRRIYRLLRDGGFTAIITTNSIIDGNVRKDGLEQVVATGGQINMAVRGIKWPGTAKLVVSLLSVHKGKWDDSRILDNRPVELINAFFEVGEDTREPVRLAENSRTMYQGSIFRGDGFLLTHEQADALILRDQKNEEVIKLIINGKEINNEPNQVPGRSTIDFFNMIELEASKYLEPFSIVSSLVKPVRMALHDKTAINQDHRNRWWQYAFVRESLYKNICGLRHCFVAARTTKHFSFSAMPTNYVYSDALYVFTTDRWDLFATIQSTLHEVWARKYSGSLKQDLRYSPSKCFDTFAFPSGLWQTEDPNLAELGERYHTHRNALMQSLWLGLTKLYNLFHARELSPEMIAKESRKDGETVANGFKAVLEMRHLHCSLDLAVRDAYGWNDLDLQHDFYEVETLPENDRVRYTVSESARREILKRLLDENYSRTGPKPTNPSTKTTHRGRKSKTVASLNLFTRE